MPVTLAPGVSRPTVTYILSKAVSLASLGKVLLSGWAGTWLAGPKVRVAIVTSDTYLTVGAHCVFSAVLGGKERLVWHRIIVKHDMIFLFHPASKNYSKC